ARRDQAWAHRRNVATRVRPPRRRAVHRPSARSHDPCDLGAVRHAPAGGVRRAHHRVRAARGLVTEYWCELAWLGGLGAAAGVLLRVEGDRFAALTPGVAVAPAAAERLAGLTLPGLANAHSHVFHRALRGRTQAGAATFWTWREQMYRAASRLT